MQTSSSCFDDFPLGIAGSDILDYLPVEHFVPHANSWTQLREDLARDKGGAAFSESQFKEWLRGKHGVDLSPEAIARAAKAADPPPEIIALFAQIQARPEAVER